MQYFDYQASPSAAYSPADRPGTIFIVDDDVSILDSLKWVFESTPYQVETFTSGEDFIAKYDKSIESPGVVICDLRMPGYTGMDVQEHLIKRGDKIPFIFLTGHGDVTDAVKALKRGAVDFLQKPCKLDELKALAIRTLEKYRENYRVEIQSRHYRLLLERLTPREKEVLSRIVAGRLNKQIADDLAISIKTVEAHRASIMDKTGSKTVAHLMRVVVLSELFDKIAGFSDVEAHSSRGAAAHFEESPDLVRYGRRTYGSDQSDSAPGYGTNSFSSDYFGHNR